jgi:uncharacterized repeat protein (TIGR01451 family)
MNRKSPPKRSRVLLGIALFGAVLGIMAESVAGQTPEGTVITNTATVSFTDANTNTYSTVQASVNVTVGFQAGIDVVAGAATATPASPSTDNDLTFDVVNDGNGTDSVTVGTVITDTNVITNVRYLLGATPYANLAALNTALAGTGIAGGGVTLTVTVRYDVGSGQGGNPSTLTVTATSRRDVGASDSDATIVTPPITGTISVTPDGGQGLQLLPSNGTQYTATFSVTNAQTGSDDLDLLASFDNGNITIVSVNSEAGDSARALFTTGESKNIDVIYTVNDVAAGSTDNLNLLARSVANGATNDTGYFDLTVVRPSISITKEAWDDAQSAQIAGTVLPGDYIQYKITVTNGGTADASSISVSDPLPAEVTYDSSAGDGGSPAWGLSEVTGTVTATLATLAQGASRFFWIRVQIN